MRARPSASRWVRPLTVSSKPRHQLDHVAGPVPAVELGGDHLVPAVACTAPLEPGRQKINEPSTSPAQARDCKVESPTVW